MGILAKNKIKILMIAIFAAFSIGGNAFADSGDPELDTKLFLENRTSTPINDPMQRSQELKVLVIEVDPVLKNVVNKTLYKNNNGSPKVSEWFGFDVDKNIKELKRDIQEASRNYFKVNIVKREYINEFPHYTIPFESEAARNDASLKKAGIHKFDEKDYTLLSRAAWDPEDTYSPWRGDFAAFAGSQTVKWFGDQLAKSSNSIFDYEWLIKKLDLVNRRNKGEFDQIWMFTIPPIGSYETLMVGRNSYWINGSPIKKDCDNFLWAGFEITRPDSMLHSLGHAMENIMTKVYGNRFDYYSKSTYKVTTKKQFEALNYWEKYTMTPLNNNTNMTGVGTVHNPYNTKKEYGYLDDTLAVAKTNWREWLNYPSVPGNSFVSDDFASVRKSAINTPILNDPKEEQSNDRLWLRFWFWMMPHYAGTTTNGYSLNWAKYFYSMDKAKMLKESVGSTNRSNVKKGTALCAGYGIRYISGKTDYVCNVKYGASVKIADTKVIDFVDGVLKGKAAGTTDVTFAHDGQKLTIKVTVK